MKLLKEYVKRNGVFIKKWGWTKFYGFCTLAMVIAVLPTTLVLYPIASYDFPGRFFLIWVLLVTFHTIIFYKHFYNEFMVKKKKIKEKELWDEI